MNNSDACNGANCYCSGGYTGDGRAFSHPIHKPILYPKWTKPRIKPSKVIECRWFFERETKESKCAREEWEVNEVARRSVIAWIDTFNSRGNIFQ